MHLEQTGRSLSEYGAHHQAWEALQSSDDKRERLIGSDGAALKRSRVDADYKDPACTEKNAQLAVLRADKICAELKKL